MVVEQGGAERGGDADGGEAGAVVERGQAIDQADVAEPERHHQHREQEAEGRPRHAPAQQRARAQLGMMACEPGGDERGGERDAPHRAAEGADDRVGRDRDEDEHHHRPLQRRRRRDRELARRRRHPQRGREQQAQADVRQDPADRGDRQHGTGVGVERDAADLGDDHVHRVRHRQRGDAGRHEHRERERDQHRRLLGIAAAHHRQHHRRQHQDRGVVVEQGRRCHAEGEHAQEQRRRRGHAGLDPARPPDQEADAVGDLGQHHDRRDRDEGAAQVGDGVAEVVGADDADGGEDRDAEERRQRRRDPERRADAGPGDHQPQRHRHRRVGR